MIEQDTIKLLRECDAGVKMGISSIDYVLSRVEDDRLCKSLTECKNRHQLLSSELQRELKRFGDEGKNPNPVARSMSHMKTNAKLLANSSDSTIAGLMTDGCNMGVKSLSRYLNEYQAADEWAKDAAKKLIRIEEDLSTELRQYL